MAAACQTCSAALSSRNTSGYCRECSNAVMSETRRKPRRPCDTCGKTLARGTKGRTCSGCLTAATPSQAESFDVQGETAILNAVKPSNPRTLADLIAVCEIDTTEWKIDRWTANKWEQGAKGPDGELVSQPLYQIKVWLTRNAPVMDARREIDALKAAAKAAMPPRPKVVRGATGPYMLEVAIPDLHIGKLAWSPETGGPDYDLKEAERVFREAVEAIILRTSAFAFERIIFPLGNDLLHSDTKQSMTFNGTQLDTDSRYYKAFGVARSVVTWAVDRLRTLAPVDLIMVPGNHDQMSTWHLGDSLECFFHHADDVTVDNAPTSRKYVGYGSSAIMFTHGHKKLDYPLLFATERPDLFGQAKFRECHTGHLHTTRLIEKHGVRVRISPALCSADAWHAEHGFVGNIRGAEGFVWHKTDGLVCVTHFNLPD